MNSTTADVEEDAPNPEVLDRPKRRRFTFEYKLDILKELDSAERGTIGGILRREGLYRSQASTWRQQRLAGQLGNGKAKKMGRPQKRKQAMEDDNVRLQRENKRLEDELRKARFIIEVQKKVSEMLEEPNAPQLSPSFE